MPVSPHDAAGPANLVAGARVMTTVPNFYRLESGLIQLRLENPGGRLLLLNGPALGIELDLDYLRGNALDGFGG